MKNVVAIGTPFVSCINHDNVYINKSSFVISPSKYVHFQMVKSSP